MYMKTLTISKIPAYGSFSKDVRILQERLIELGFDPKGADGIYGMNTQQAVISLQLKNKLQGSGVIGPKTLGLLKLVVSDISVITDSPLITKDIKNKKDRHLHPNMRQRLEAYLFANGNVPDFWTNKKLSSVCIAVQEALAELGVKENGRNNYGTDVGEVQGTTGGFTPGGNGDAWCLDFAQMKVAIIEDFYQKESPVPATANCVDCWKGSEKVAGLTTSVPTIGTLALAQYINNPTRGHAMECYELLGGGQMRTVEGNTSANDMTNGNNSGFNVRNQKLNNRDTLRTLGFVYVYPDNQVPA